jgi:hypothetical protein
MTYEADELRRGWKKCYCPIYASGTLSGRFNRKNTERTAWIDAKAVAADWDTAGSWDGPVKRAEQPTAPAPPPDDASPPRITIADATRAYLAIREGAAIAPATLRKHRTFTKKLTAFADQRVCDARPVHIDRHRRVLRLLEAGAFGRRARRLAPCAGSSGFA